MIEKVIENWLIKTTERSFGRAFCYLLMSEGHTIIHLTKHNPMERGKDVISISPSGALCAFQLKTAKGGTLNLSQWRSDVEPQLYDLIEVPIEHPSITDNRFHDSYIVTNGTLDEKVQSIIHSRNERYKTRNFPDFQLKSIVKGELLQKAIKATDFLLPDEINDFRRLFKLLLSIYVTEGQGSLPKKEFISLIEILLRIRQEERLSNAEASRIVSSTAFIVSVATSIFTENKNYFAEIESWSLFISYVIAFAKKNKIPKQYYHEEIKLAQSIVSESLESLLDEVSGRQHFIEGDITVDHTFLPYRLAILAGLMAAYSFQLEDNQHEKLDRIKKFIIDNFLSIGYWGDSAFPYLFCVYKFLTKHAPQQARVLLRSILHTVISLNNPRNVISLPNSYYTLEELLPVLCRLEEIPKDRFAGNSSVIEPVVYLLTKIGDREFLSEQWRLISKIANRSFEPDNDWEHFVWRAKLGVDITYYFNETQSWSKLQERVTNNQSSPVECLESHTHILLHFMFFPFRLNANSVLWLDSVIN